jgi:hypothetical protein
MVLVQGELRRLARSAAGQIHRQAHVLENETNHHSGGDYRVGAAQEG